MENEDALRQAFIDGASLHGIDEWMAFGERYWAEDIEMTEDPSWPGAATFRGRREVAQRFAEYMEAFDEGAGQLDALHRNGDLYVAEIRFSVRGSGSGVPIEQRWAWLMHLRDGRTHSIRSLRDVAEALAEAGL